MKAKQTMIDFDAQEHSKPNKVWINIVIRFDGGCLVNPGGLKYGSYLVQLAGCELLKASRIELGFGTNNEAEFDILLVALESTCAKLRSIGVNLKDCALLMLTDSTIVRNRVSGKSNKHRSEPEQRMHALALRCRTLVAHFGTSEIEWRKRDENVRVFGH